MERERELAESLWKRLRKDRVVMLGLSGVEDGHSQPMTAQIEDDDLSGPIWFFSAKDTEFVRQLGAGRRAVAHFAAKDHDLFASIDGTLAPYHDRATVERLWNPFVAAWYEGGRDDPRLQLLRLDVDRAQVWENSSGLVAGVKVLLGRDPKKDYEGKMADLQLPPRTG